MVVDQLFNGLSIVCEEFCVGLCFSMHYKGLPWLQFVVAITLAK